MQRIPSTPPEIAPLGKSDERPFWSVMIPAYNCSVFLPDAIQSVLSQDPGEAMMQIEVVDDCSTDADVGALVKRLGKGRVSYYRQEKNMGSLRNFETCINRAQGYHIHLLHGDDRVKPGYYQHIQSLFKKYPEAGAAFCAWNNIDEENNILRRSAIEVGKPDILVNWLPKLAEHTRIQYVAIVVKREVYEKLGSFYGVTYGEDWEMWARVARDYPIAYTPEILAEYREHKSSISSNSFLTGKNIQDISKVIHTISGYLPQKDQKKINRLAHKNFVHWSFQYTKYLWKQTRNARLAYNQVKEMLRVYIDLRLLILLFMFGLMVLADFIFKLLKKLYYRMRLV
ncbi:glycosyltransferase family 2 protein [Mucilaginibacter sp.]|uniref:glycosyltransferase family 2 protein n=1 Tax=Mucilaginibacter sp. TaxID=1882438 RepID=UPI003AFF796B